MSWKDPKRYLWLLGAVVPGLVAASWLVVWATGLGEFWWAGPILAFGVIPVLDHMIGPDADNPPDSALAWLENDRMYRWATYLYLPNQYGSVLLACWLWSGGGWLTMGFADKLGLMATTGLIGGLAINAAHELGHTRVQTERRLSKVALAQTCYGHFFVEHTRGHHVRVATAEDPASARLGESLYAFIPRSVFGSLRSAWSLEARRLAGIGKPRWTLGNDVLNAWLISIALYTVLSVWFGPVVLPWLAGQAIIGFCLLETINYLEHYGLRRQKLSSGRYERVRPAHSWNSEHGGRQRPPVPFAAPFRSSRQSAAQLPGAAPCRRGASTPERVQRHAAGGVVSAVVASGDGPACTRLLSRRHPIGSTEAPPAILRPCTRLRSPAGRWRR